MHRTLTFAGFQLLRRLDPERAHDLSLRGIRLGLVGRAAEANDAILQVSALGLTFRNPIGLAAGFDKNAVAVAGLARLGFGFVETGTVTPRPQRGNPRPRLFRLKEDGAIINRLGFNNLGLAPFLKQLGPKSRHAVPVGANVGINSQGADPERDYLDLVSAVSAQADYVVINVSSPNTAGLRALQTPARLRALLRSVSSRTESACPLLVKISPDLTESELEALIDICVSNGVQGLVVSNTTLARTPALRSPRRGEAGGLSGTPLFAQSTAVLARAHKLARGRLTLIGVGGVRTGADAFAKIQAGAHLVQLYTAFAYEGPNLLPRVMRELATELRKCGFSRIEDAVGSDVGRLANLVEMDR